MLLPRGQPWAEPAEEPAPPRPTSHDTEAGSSGAVPIEVLDDKEEGVMISLGGGRTCSCTFDVLFTMSYHALSGTASMKRS